MKLLKYFLIIIMGLTLAPALTQAQTLLSSCQWIASIPGDPYGDPCRGGAANWIKAPDQNSCEAKPEGNFTCCCPYYMVNPPQQQHEKPLFVLPEPQIKIPGLTFSPTSSILTDWDETTGSYGVSIPWIAEYIKGIYQYGLAIAGILAALVLMGGGLLWLVSGGEAGKITQSKELIIGSVTGLLILFGSYIILAEINPNLINLRPIVMHGIAKDPFDLPINEQSLAPESAGDSHGVPWYFQCSQQGQDTLYNYGGNNGKQKCGEDSKQAAKYGAGKSPNICTSGCGVVSLMMVLGKLNINPGLKNLTDTVTTNGGRVCGSGSSIDGLIKAARTHGAKAGLVSRTDIPAKLDAGHPVVILVREPGGNKCPFTGGGHYIVLTGWREKQNNFVDVNDPSNTNKVETRRWISLSNMSGCSFEGAFYVYK